MTEPIDVTYVELRARGEDEAAHDIKVALDSVKKSVRVTSQEIERGLKNAFDDATDAVRNDLTAAAAEADVALRKLGADGSRALDDAGDEAAELSVELLGAAAAAKVLDRQLNEANDELKHLALQFATTGDRVFAGRIKETQGLIRELPNTRKILGDVSQDAVGVFTKLYRSVRDGDSLLGSAFRGIEGLGSKITGVFSDVAKSGQSNFGALGVTLSSFGGVLTSVGTALTNVLTAVPLLTIIAALTPVIVAVGSSLVNLLGLLAAVPAAITVLVAAIAPLIIAFNGMGDALSALASGDIDKINEAMKNLAPSAQRVARELNELRKPLHDIKLAVQEAFFRPLIGQLTELGKVIFPVLRRGLTEVAGALGQFARAFVQLLGANDILVDIRKIFTTTANVIKTLTPPIIKLLGVMFGVIEHALPFIQRGADALGNLLNRLSAFISKSLQTGSFEKFIENAITSFKAFGTLIVSVTRFLGALFGSTAEEGDSFLISLAKIIDRMTAFLKSSEGQKGLHALVNILGTLVKVTNAVITVLGVINDAVITFKDAASEAADNIGEFFRAVDTGVSGVLDKAVEFFRSLVDFLAGLGPAFSDAFDAVVNFFAAFGDLITGLPGQVVAALQALPGLLVDFFTTLFDQLTFAVGFGIGAIVRFFIDLPGRVIAAVTSLYDLLTAFFTSIFNTLAVLGQLIVDNVVFIFTQLPGRVFNAVVSLLQLLVGIFNNVQSRVISTVISIVNTVVGIFSQMPGRASGAVSSLPGRILGILRGIVSGAYNIGRDIINGVARGIGDALGGAIDAAKRAARNILEGAKRAIEGHSPSRLFAREVGVPISQGIGVGITEGAPAAERSLTQTIEALLPAGAAGGTTPPVATAGAPTPAGAMISFAQGAVQVIFQGVVPTAQEALRTGQAVGSGIAQTLANRDVRTLVRVT